MLHTCPSLPADSLMDCRSSTQYFRLPLGLSASAGHAPHARPSGHGTHVCSGPQMYPGQQGWPGPHLSPSAPSGHAGGSGAHSPAACRERCELEQRLLHARALPMQSGERQVARARPSTGECTVVRSTLASRPGRELRSQHEAPTAAALEMTGTADGATGMPGCALVMGSFLHVLSQQESFVHSSPSSPAGSKIMMITIMRMAFLYFY